MSGLRESYLWEIAFVSHFCRVASGMDVTHTSGFLYSLEEKIPEISVTCGQLYIWYVMCRKIDYPFSSFCDPRSYGNQP